MVCIVAQFKKLPLHLVLAVQVCVLAVPCG